MVINMRYLDYHYKHATLTPKDAYEECTYNLTNEYGYNFGLENKLYINEENLFMRPKNFVNKDYICKKK